MKHLENYYRNLCEQLQQQIAILEAKMKDKKKDKKDSKKGSKKEKMADKDYDGDGEVESSKDEYFGSKDKAIKKKMAEKKKMIKEGREIHGGIMNYGGFPRVIRENAVTQDFQDSPNDGQINVATKPNDEEITWNAKAYGTPYPSQSFADVASAAIAAGDVVGKLHDKARTAMGPNYQERGFLQDPAFLAAREQQLAAQEAMKAHPHYGEAQRGHPSTRRGPLTPDEQTELRGYGIPGSGSRWTGD
jgi:hypothetical protein